MIATKTDRTIECHNPANGIRIGSVKMSTMEEVNTVREDLRQATPLWANRPVKERVRILRQLQKVMLDSADEITTIINKDTGKSRQDALIELFIVVDNLQQMCKKADKWLKREPISSGLYFTKRTYVERRPFGTVAVIAPWNYPFLLAVQPVLTALLAGNTVMLKPSEVTAMVGLLIEKLFKRVPELAPFVRVLHGDGEVGAAAVASQPDLIYLTGSTNTGRIIAKAAAEHLIPTIFELGGKDPMIVLEDAELQAAAKWGAWGAFYNAGQTCVSIERVYVVEEVYEQFLQHLLTEVKQLSVGYSDEIKDFHHYGPLSSERQLAIVEEHIQDALEKGARILTGGDSNGLFLQPTVLVDVDESMKLLQEETFGPLMPVIKVRDEQEAIQRANTSEFGLSASVWGSVGRAERVLQQIEAGALVANDVIAHSAVPTLPFGGVKKSGNGRSHGKYDLWQFTQTRSYMVSAPPKSFDIATQMREPGNYRLGEAVMKLAFGVTLQQRIEPIERLIKSGRTQNLIGRIIGAMRNNAD